MTSDLARMPAYRHALERLEQAKRLNSQGGDYWMAREIHAILGYADWDGFQPSIARAESAIRVSGGDPSHHIRHTTKMVVIGSGAKRRVGDAFLSRGACYLIAMNGDPTKPEISGAQQYFAIQTRSAELAQQEEADRKRLNKREKVTAAAKRVADVAKDAGVQRYPLSQNARYQGLYEMNKRELDRLKGLSPGEALLDRAGTLELSAHEFQMELVAAKISNEGINGEQHAIAANLQVAKDVRSAVLRQGVRLEQVPLEAESISSVRKRLTPTTRLDDKRK